MASELQRRCQQAAKLAFKEETKEYKTKQQQQRQRMIEKSVAKLSLEKDEADNNSRRPAIDLTEAEVDGSGGNGIYKKKKKKHRLKSDQSHSRLGVDKVVHRAHSSEDLFQGFQIE